MSRRDLLGLFYSVGCHQFLFPALRVERRRYGFNGPGIPRFESTRWETIYNFTRQREAQSSSFTPSLSHLLQINKPFAKNLA